MLLIYFLLIGFVANMLLISLPKYWQTSLVCDSALAGLFICENKWREREDKSKRGTGEGALLGDGEFAPGGRMGMRRCQEQDLARSV